MVEEKSFYRVAGLTFCVAADTECASWKNLKWHYEPFQVDEAAPLYTIHVRYGSVETAQMAEVYADSPKEDGFFQLNVYRDESERLVFAIKYPQQKAMGGWLIVNKEMTDFETVICENQSSAQSQTKWLQESIFTTASMLSFMLATNASDTLTMHSSCVVKDGRGYLFLGKSGTGKSTHARLWQKNIEGTSLLNDDHPIIRISEDGKAIVYGSPWSGKTDCYVNDKAEICAIVKIEQAPHNKIRRLSKIEAYSKLMVSASGMTWFEGMAAARHKTIEKVIATIPFYELECLPDDDAARVSHDAISYRQ